MIVYQLACAHGHFFEGWFASAEACARQSAAGQLTCPTCASSEVSKLPSAPYVKGERRAREGEREAREAGAPGGRPRGDAVQALRNFILTNTDDVGRKFAEVARRMHYGEEEARGIRGQASIEEALELQEEGIPAIAVSPEVLPTEEIH
jgi:hypothetical protein